MTRVTRLTTLGAALITFGLMAGCSFYDQTEQAEYDKVFAATETVLSKYYRTRSSDFVEGHIIAYSRVSEMQGEQARIKIDASIRRDVEGFFHPHLVCVNQMNVAVATAGHNTRGRR